MNRTFQLIGWCMLVIAVTVLTGSRGYAVVAPSELSGSDKRDGFRATGQELEMIRQSALDLQKVSAEMDAEQKRHTERLKSIKNELEHVQLQLNPEAGETAAHGMTACGDKDDQSSQACRNHGMTACGDKDDQSSQACRNHWIPAKIAMVLGTDSN